VFFTRPWNAGIEHERVDTWDAFLALVEGARPTIIGLSGYARAGKDTVGGILVEDHDFTRISFADALKAVLYDLDPIIDDPSAYYIATLVENMGWEAAKQHTPIVRHYLQRLGSAVRGHVGEDAWVRAALRHVEPGGRYVITDVRYPNEAEEIKRLGGVIWRVTRPGYGPANEHISETALDDWNFDGVVPNQWDTAYLREYVGEYLSLSESL
jgi:hypothetical protein